MTSQPAATASTTSAVESAPPERRTRRGVPAAGTCSGRGVRDVGRAALSRRVALAAVGVRCDVTFFRYPATRPSTARMPTTDSTTPIHQCQISAASMGRALPRPCGADPTGGRAVGQPIRPSASRSVWKHCSIRAAGPAASRRCGTWRRSRPSARRGSRTPPGSRGSRRGGTGCRRGPPAVSSPSRKVSSSLQRLVAVTHESVPSSRPSAGPAAWPASPRACA